MNTISLDATRWEAFLTGAATLFDLSGTGVFSSPPLGSLSSDMEALEADLAAIGGDFRAVLWAEAERIEKEDAR